MNFFMVHQTCETRNKKYCSTKSSWGGDHNETGSIHSACFSYAFWDFLSQRLLYNY